MSDPTLTAAAWILDHIKSDPDVAATTAYALMERGYASVGEWARASPEEVVMFQEALASMVEQIPLVNDEVD